MACSPDSDGGWATAAAMAYAMSLALMASALTALASAELRGARSELGTLKTQYALDEAHRLAVLAVMKTDKPARLRWSFQAQGIQFQALAESEPAKLSLDEAARLGDADFDKLGVKDAPALRGRLKAAIGQEVALGELDAAPRWRECAASLVSAFGQAKTLSMPAAGQPNEQRFDWRVSDVWRIRVTGDRWSDERLVRFTGDAVEPAAVISRTLSRQTQEPPCDTVLQG